MKQFAKIILIFVFQIFLFSTLGIGRVFAAEAFEYWSSARYEIPTVDPALQPLSTFDLKLLGTKKIDSQTEVSYELPKELDGLGQIITMRGTESADGTIQFSGDKGSMTCSEAAGMCAVRFRQLQLNKRQLLLNLHSVSSTQSEFDARLRIARVFGGDPVGRIFFEPQAIIK